MNVWDVLCVRLGQGYVLAAGEQYVEPGWSHGPQRASLSADHKYPRVGCRPRQWQVGHHNAYSVIFHVS